MSYDFGPGGRGFAGTYDDWRLEDGDDPGRGPYVKPSLTSCTVCDWKGDFTGAVAHFRLTDHPLTWKGTVQNMEEFRVTREELMNRR